MSCLRPLKVVNPRYKKYDYKPLGKYLLEDYYLYVPCGLCRNCLKRRSSEWRLRLIHEIKYMPPKERKNVKILMLSVSPEYYDRISADPSRYIRLFLERYRRKYKTSVKHWITNEFGDVNNRLHFHGIFFDLKTTEYSELLKLWKYGHIFIQSAPIGRIVYITKYITKCIKDKSLFIRPEFKPLTWCSPGIGKKYCEDPFSIKNSHIDGKLCTQVHNSNYSYQMPRYYKEKLFTKRELLSIRYDMTALQLKKQFSINKKQLTNEVEYYKYLHDNFHYIPLDFEKFL